MHDLISRQALCEYALNQKDKSVTPNDIMRFPSAQPERKRGKWINVNEGKWNVLEVLKCSACGEIDNRMYRTDSYCPNCGADMRHTGGEQSV